MSVRCYVLYYTVLYVARSISLATVFSLEILFVRVSSLENLIILLFASFKNLTISPFESSHPLIPPLLVPAQVP